MTGPVVAVESFKALEASLPDNVDIPLDVDYAQVASSFLSLLEAATKSEDPAALEALFLEHCHWRDHIALTASLRSIAERPAVLEAWLQTTARAQPHRFALVADSTSVIRPFSGLAWLQGRFTFATEHPPASCSGTFRLVPGPRGYRAWVLSSTFEQLNGHVPNVHATAPQVDVETVQRVDVLIIGAGQWGTQIGAHLATLGIQHLIVDSYPGAGDSWRVRYDLLCLHTPKAYGHPAYMPYEDDVPEHVPTKLVGQQYRKLADRFRLPLLSSSTVTRARLVDGKWRVEISTPAGPRVISAGHLLLCAGAGSQQPWSPTLPGQKEFAGVTKHSSAYMNGKDFAGKRAVVVGTANSGHDMAQDLYLSGCASVTLVQREKTFVVAREHLGKLLTSLYNPTNTSEVADRLSYGTPLAVNRKMAMRIHTALVNADSERFDRLEAAGFGLHRYADLLSFTLGRGGGHYVDIGCSKLIADGKVQIKRGSPISHFNRDGLVFEDGSQVGTDVVVFATGFRDKNLRIIAREIIGDELADRISDVWNVDSDGEVRGVWRPCGIDNFIICAGDVAISRFYSHIIAQQLLIAQEGQRLSPFDVPTAQLAAMYEARRATGTVEGSSKRADLVRPAVSTMEVPRSSVSVSASA